MKPTQLKEGKQVQGDIHKITTSKQFMTEEDMQALACKNSKPELACFEHTVQHR
jgi:hypothetical protein